jgi:hypothetical protein
LRSLFVGEYEENQLISSKFGPITQSMWIKIRYKK